MVREWHLAKFIAQAHLCFDLIHVFQVEWSLTEGAAVAGCRSPCIVSCLRAIHMVKQLELLGRMSDLLQGPSRPLYTPSLAFWIWIVETAVAHIIRLLARAFTGTGLFLGWEVFSRFIAVRASDSYTSSSGTCGPHLLLIAPWSFFIRSILQELILVKPHHRLDLLIDALFRAVAR